ncbi:MAG: response regulator [Cyclobacteriaceae bacterium]
MPSLIKYYLLLLIILFSGGQLAFANDDPLEDLVQAIDTLDAEDQAAKDSLWSLSLPYFRSKRDSSVAKINYAWGIHYFDNYKFDSARVFLERAIKRFERYETEASDMAKYYYVLGNVYYDQEHLKSAITTYIKSLNIYDSLQDWQESAHVLNVIAGSYSYLGDHSLAEKNYKRAINIQKQYNDSASVAYMLLNLGSLYTTMKQYELALEIYDECKSWSNTKEMQELQTEFGKAIIYHEQKRYNEALEGYLSAEILCKEVKDFVELAYVYQNLADLHVDMENLAPVRDYLGKAQELSQEYDIGGMEFGLNEIRHKLFYKEGKYQMAYDMLTKVKAESDSFFDLDMSRQLKEVAAEYELMKGEKELALKDLELVRASEQIEKAKKQKSILLAAAIVFMIGAIVILRSQRVKAKANRELEEKNRKIEKMTEELRKMEATRSKWYINISHELRTPLTLVQGPIKHALETLPKQDPVIKDLEIADRNVTRLQKLINEILDLSNLESGKIRINKMEFDLINTIASVIGTFEHLSKDRNIKVDFDHQGASSVLVFGDHDKIQNVLIHLIANAFESTEPNDKINVTLEHNGELKLTVKDNGPGMSKTQLRHVFDKEYHAEVLNSGQREGIGVGLVLAQEIVNLHGATMTVDSLEGVGSKYTITFPPEFVLHTEKGQEVKPVLEDYQDNKHSAGSVSTLMVVDDNLDMRNYIRKLLSKDYEIITAVDGKDALEKMEQTTPDLIISDVMMPRINGIELAREVKNSPEWKHIPFITISAIGEEQDRVSTLRIGIDDYLVKPFNPEELSVRVENLLRNTQERNKPELPNEEAISSETKLIKTLEKFVLDDIKNTNINVARLADLASMSERQVYRYIRKMTGLSPANFIKEIRLQKAKELLMKNNYGRASDVAYAVGFQQPGYFSTVFKKRFGRSPSEYID